MATTKKAKPANKKAEYKYGTSPTAAVSGLSTLLMGSGRTVEMSEEDRSFRREMNAMQIATMKADLRRHIADADLAETLAARAKFDFEEMKKACKIGPRK